MKSFLLAVSATFLLAGTVRSQAISTPLGVGVDQRVRVAAPVVFTGKMTGRVVSPVGDTLFLKQNKVVRPIPVEAITEVEVSRGRNRLLWSFLGATAGFFVGGVLGGSTHNSTGSDYGALLGVIGGVTVGTIGGAVVGAIAAPERWKRTRP